MPWLRTSLAQPGAVHRWPDPVVPGAPGVPGRGSSPATGASSGAKGGRSADIREKGASVGPDDGTGGTAAPTVPGGEFSPRGPAGAPRGPAPARSAVPAT